MLTPMLNKSSCDCSLPLEFAFALVAAATSVGDEAKPEEVRLVSTSGGDREPYVGNEWLPKPWSSLPSEGAVAVFALATAAAAPEVALDDDAAKASCPPLFFPATALRGGLSNVLPADRTDAGIPVTRVGPCPPAGLAKDVPAPQELDLLGIGPVQRDPVAVDPDQAATGSSGMREGLLAQNVSAAPSVLGRHHGIVLFLLISRKGL
jgi:hypothetical protein